MPEITSIGCRFGEGAREEESEKFNNLFQELKQNISTYDKERLPIIDIQVDHIEPNTNQIFLRITHPIPKVQVGPQKYDLYCFDAYEFLRFLKRTLKEIEP